MPRPLYPRERAPGTHWIGGWVGPRAVLDAVVKRKIPSSSGESNPTTPIVQSVAQRYTDWAITALMPLYGYSEISSSETKTSTTAWNGRVAQWSELTLARSKKKNRRILPPPRPPKHKHTSEVLFQCEEFENYISRSVWAEHSLPSYEQSVRRVCVPDTFLINI
jgi:hypothetical protein